MEEHKIVHILASPKQLSKLRNGRAVRVKPVAEGMGIPMIVHSHRYSPIQRAFQGSKGIEIALTPNELQNNKMMEGQGIFGKKFDNMLKKAGVKKLAYKLADSVKTPVVEGIRYGIPTALGGATVAGAAGSLGIGAAPLSFLTAASVPLANTLADYVDNPNKFKGTSNAGGSRGQATPTLRGALEENQMYKDMNNHLGTQFGALQSAALGNAAALNERANLANQAINARRNEIAPQLSASPSIFNTTLSSTIPTSSSFVIPPQQKIGEAQIFGFGLHHKHHKGKGLGLYLGRGLHHHHREKGSVGRMGGFVGATQHIPPALQSQPLAANFQFRHTLPPSYQAFTR